MAGGRPTDYSEEILKKTEEYINTTTNLPTIQELAFLLKVNQDTIYEWAKVHKEFSETLNDLRNYQASKLINRGLNNEYNATIAKLILSANHGMKERVDTTTNDKDLPTPIYGSKSTDV